MNIKTEMTQESLFDGLVDTEIPSRTVLTSVLQDGLLKKSIFASNSFIYHFDDIRDAIDLVLRSVRCEDKHNSINGGWISTGKPRGQELKPQTQKQEQLSQASAPLVFNLNHYPTSLSSLKMNELFNSEEVRFACSLASENLLNCQQDFRKANVRLPSASILISLEFLNVNLDSEIDGDRDQECNMPSITCTFNNTRKSATAPVPFERVDVLVDTIKGLLIEFGGPLLACSDLKRCLRTGSTFKFFAEFYRVSDCKRFLETSDRLGGQVVSDENVQISFEGVQLYDIDREALFFSSNELVEGSCDSQRRKDSISSIEDSVLTETGSYCSIASMSSTSSLTANSLTPSHSPSNSHSHSSSYSGSHFHSNSISSNISQSFEIDLWKIESGLEKRTTCMIKNIPNKYNQQMIYDLVNETHRGCFDFLYLRMDFRNRCNVGYAFINFTHPDHILSFARRVNGKRWAHFNSDKICHLTFARIQGTAALIEKFRNSKVMFEAPAYRPKLFHTDGPFAGQEIPFPT